MKSIFYKQEPKIITSASIMLSFSLSLIIANKKFCKQVKLFFVDKTPNTNITLIYQLNVITVILINYIIIA